MSIFQYGCYRQVLQWKLDEFIQGNPQQSLRGFSKYLDVSPSRLSEILAGKGNFAARTAERISVILTDHQMERDYFIGLHQLAVAKLKQDRAAIKQRLAKIKAQSLFTRVDFEGSPVKDWFHYAILFLLSVNPYISIDQLSQTLNLSSQVVEEALADLSRYGYIEYDQHRQRVIQGFLKVDGGTSSQAIRQFHKAMISKSLHAMTQVPIEKRHFWSHIFTLNKERYENVVTTLTEVLDQLTIEDNGCNSQEIYCIGAQFFPLSHRPDN